jgi:glycosyltransferase involved in cell wall biosynthesis
MKILHVFPFFSVKFGGGTCDLMYKLARAQKECGHEVTIYTGHYMLDREYADSLAGVTVKAFYSVFNSLRLYLSLTMISEAKTGLKNFDIIHLHAFRTFQNIVIHHYAKKYNVPYVMDAHGSAPLHTRRRGLKRLFDFLLGYKILKNASKCIGETNMGCEEYRELGVADNEIVLVPPPFPVEEFEKLPPEGLFRDKFNIADKRIVMFLGRIHEIKGIDFLVESFYELTKIRDDVLLVIVGSDDGFKSILEELIARLKISDKVLFTGFMSGDAKLSALVDADIVVQTSRYEQGAWAPIEAVLCNTPIIVSSNSGAGEDVKRMDAGYLVQWGNRTELRDLMQMIFDSPAEAMAKVKKGKEHVRNNLSMSSKVREYEKLYLDCMSSK